MSISVKEAMEEYPMKQVRRFRHKEGKKVWEVTDYIEVVIEDGKEISYTVTYNGDRTKTGFSLSFCLGAVAKGVYVELKVVKNKIRIFKQGPKGKWGDGVSHVEFNTESGESAIVWKNGNKKKDSYNIKEIESWVEDGKWIEVFTNGATKKAKSKVEKPKIRRFTYKNSPNGWGDIKYLEFREDDDWKFCYVISKGGVTKGTLYSLEEAIKQVNKEKSNWKEVIVKVKRVISRGEIRVAHAKYPEGVFVRVYTIEGFLAVTKSIDPEKGNYVITHLPTGKRIGSKWYASTKKAKEAARELSQIDWGFDYTSIENQKECLKQLQNLGLWEKYIKGD